MLKVKMLQGAALLPALVGATPAAPLLLSKDR